MRMTDLQWLRKEEQLNARPAERNARPAERNARPAERNARPAERNARPAERNARPAERNAAALSESDDKIVKKLQSSSNLTICIPFSRIIFEIIFVN